MDGAEEVVLDMVACGWGAAMLDTVPAGIAVPLREAVQHCRHNPPTGASARATFAQAVLTRSITAVDAVSRCLDMIQTALHPGFQTLGNTSGYHLVVEARVHVGIQALLARRAPVVRSYTCQPARLLLPGWPLAAYSLIGRDDIAATLAVGTHSSVGGGGEVPQLQSPGPRTPPPIGTSTAAAAGRQAMSDDYEATLSTPVQRSSTAAAATPAVMTMVARPVRSEVVAATAAEVFPPTYRQRLQIPSAVQQQSSAASTYAPHQCAAYKRQITTSFRPPTWPWHGANPAVDSSAVSAILAKLTSDLFLVPFLS